MRGRERFTPDEISWIREQLTALRVAERIEQKRIRSGLRRAGFRISDWATDGQRLTVSGFDTLVRRGLITSGGAAAAAVPSGASRRTQARASAAARAADVRVAEHLAQAIAALTRPRNSLAACLAGAVPNAPGLYAMYGSKATWQQLGLGAPPDDRPLYVGKAEVSLVSRDLDTHFRTGQTGRSSPRRSFAALLVGTLELTSIPRRPDSPEPGRWSHYALAPTGDARLTDWMRRCLRLAVWSHPAPPALAELETAVLKHFTPPLNLNKVAQPWSAQVRHARAALAAAARDWARERGHEVEA